MTSTVRILGKERKLTGTLGHYYLADTKDVLALGVYCVLPLHLWRDEEYINKIRREQRR